MYAHREASAIEKELKSLWKRFNKKNSLYNALFIKFPFDFYGFCLKDLKIYIARFIQLK